MCYCTIAAKKRMLSGGDSICERDSPDEAQGGNRSVNVTSSIKVSPVSELFGSAHPNPAGPGNNRPTPTFEPVINLNPALHHSCASVNTTTTSSRMTIDSVSQTSRQAGRLPLDSSVHKRGMRSFRSTPLLESGKR